jgi:glycosyltransferase involved in cell wall biosynthesis
MSIHFSVFVPAFNCEAFIKRCLHSILEQDYVNFDLVLEQDYVNFDLAVVDDDSTDSTREIISSVVAESGPEVTAYYNPSRAKMPQNILFARRGDPNDVVIIVDGDDYLPNSRVLSTIAAYYEAEDDLWLTFGSYRREPGYPMPNPACDYPDEVKESRQFRGHGYSCYNHPITFRRHLLNRVEDWELKDDDGTWFTGAYDHALMMPMLEVAGDRWKFLPDILYVYNEDNPLSEIHVASAAADHTHAVVNGRPKRAVAH